MFKEFRDFAMRGNVLDLAVGVIIGGAFGKIVTGFVTDLIMPIIGVLLGGHFNFSNYFTVLNGATFPDLKSAQDAGAPVLAYGDFITIVIDFLIIAFVVFILVKGANALMRTRKETPAEPPPLSKDQELLTEIRDLLKQQAQTNGNGAAIM